MRERRRARTEPEGEKLKAQTLLDAAQMQARDIESALDGALAKTKTPHATYLASTPLERLLLNQTFFLSILIGDEGTVEDSQLTPVYAALSGWQRGFGRPRHLTAVPTPKESKKANPDPVYRGQGSNNVSLADPVGRSQTVKPVSRHCV